MTYQDLYEKAIRLLDNGGITIGEYDEMIKPLKLEICEWITDRKPIEDGKYMVTVKGVVCDSYIDLLFYGKPLMPNKNVKGMCWYDSDDEWGDIIYVDTEILAWMPLPKPYREDGEA